MPATTRNAWRCAAGPPLDVDTLQERLQLLLEDPRIERLNAELKPDVSPARGGPRRPGRRAISAQALARLRQLPGPVGRRRARNRHACAPEPHGPWRRSGPELRQVARGSNPLLDLSYVLPFTAHDTTFAIQYRRNDLTVVEEPFVPLNIQSDSEIYTLALRQPVYRTPSTLVALELIGERSSLDTSVLGVPFSLEPGAVDGQSVVTALRFAQEFVYRTRSQVIAARSRFSFGLDALGSTIHNNDLPDSQFFAWLGQFQWVQSVRRCRTHRTSRYPGHLPIRRAARQQAAADARADRARRTLHRAGVPAEHPGAGQRFPCLGRGAHPGRPRQRAGPTISSWRRSSTTGRGGTLTGRPEIHRISRASGSDCDGGLPYPPACRCDPSSSSIGAIRSDRSRRRPAPSRATGSTSSSCSESSSLAWCSTRRSPGARPA